MPSSSRCSLTAPSADSPMSPSRKPMLAAMDEYDQVVADYYQAREGGSPDAAIPRRDWNSQMIEKFIAPRRVSVAPYYRQQGDCLD